VKKPANSTQFTVRFALSKGEGEFPDAQDLTPAEAEDLRSICTFYLHLDPYSNAAPDPAIIARCIVYYNGVSPISNSLPEGDPYGLRLDQGCIVGRIRPIISFELETPLGPEEFKKWVWCSWYEVGTPSCGKVFCAEDWNGYTEILSPHRTSEWKLHLERNGLYSGKEFSAERLIKGVSALEM
jgi:hypothetical protein